MRDPTTSLGSGREGLAKRLIPKVNLIHESLESDEEIADVLAAVALAYVREVLKREKIIRELIKQFGLDGKVCDPKWYAPMADAIRRLLDGEGER